MKAIKSILAVSVLATAGVANAATVATWGSLSVTPSIILPGSYGNIELVQPGYTGSGSAVLDDSGVLTISAHVHVTTIVGTNNDLDILDTLTGTWDGTTFTATGGTHQYVGCVDNPPVNVPGCSSLAGAGTLPATTSGSLTLAGGTISAASADANSHATTTFTYGFGAGTPAPAVPVPAAAWLFGSGLLGLAGTARRRRAA